MSNETFQQPQRQSTLGIILIFSKVAYTFIRASWVIFAYLIIKTPSLKAWPYIITGLIFLIVLGVLYSYFYYRRFLFHIDYEKQEFVLVKGVFSTETVNIPFDKIQQVDLKRSIFQRVIGVYSLVIDTAGSKDEEIQIKAVSEDKATHLSHILTKVKNATEKKIDAETEIEDFTTTPRTEEKVWVYHLSFLNLVKIGLTRNYLRGFLLMTIFVSSIYSQTTNYFNTYIDSAESYSKSFLDSSSRILILILIMMGIVLVFSVLITIGEVVIKYFNLKIQQSQTRIEIEMGLKTNTNISFQPRRLQRLEISTNPIQKRLNLYEVKFSLASSKDDLSKSKILVPGLNREIVERVKTFLYPQHRSSEEARCYKPHQAWLNRRFIVTGVFMVLFWFIYFEALSWVYSNFLIGFSLLGLFILITYQWFYYKTIRLKVSKEFLNIHQGIWNQKQDIVELYKMEGVTIKQPFWYRRRNIYNLTFHTAGGDVSIRAIPYEFVKEIDYLIYKIETAKKAWM